MQSVTILNIVLLQTEASSFFRTLKKKAKRNYANNQN